MAKNDLKALEERARLLIEQSESLSQKQVEMIRKISEITARIESVRAKRKSRPRP